MLVLKADDIAKPRAPSLDGSKCRADAYSRLSLTMDWGPSFEKNWVYRRSSTCVLSFLKCMTRVVFLFSLITMGRLVYGPAESRPIL